MKLYTYCIPVDDGAAPNPYHGICTLAICKPVIRRTAKVGDWVVGTGSKNVNGIKHYSGKVVYAMKVTEVMNFEEYNTFCINQLPAKIPNLTTDNYIQKLGDCIYDNGKIDNNFQREGVHRIENMQTDKGGVNVLLSDHFYYFGNNPVPLPEHLLPVIHQTQGHKSNANQPFVEAFVEWIEGLGFQKNVVLNPPQLTLSFDKNGCMNNCWSTRNADGIVDKEVC